MIFGFGKKHKLPSFPEDVAPTFYRMCEVLSEEQIPKLQQELLNCTAQMRARSGEESYVDLKLLGEIEKVCLMLLESYSSYPDKKKALVIGAVRYFVVSDDPFDDAVFASGLDDDAKVLNHVLEELGLEDCCIYP